MASTITPGVPVPAKKKAKTGPTLSKLILKAVADSSDRGGLSLAGLKKVLTAGGYDVVKNKSRILVAVRRLRAKKLVVQTKGSFKLNKKPKTPRKKRAVKKTKAKVKKAKKAKKAASTKKSTKKKKATKKPKKPKKPAKKAAKKPAAAKKPKQVKARVPKKKAAAKK